jgi:hypothetical protein
VVAGSLNPIYSRLLGWTMGNPPEAGQNSQLPDFHFMNVAASQTLIVHKTYVNFIFATFCWGAILTVFLISEIC